MIGKYSMPRRILKEAGAGGDEPVMAYKEAVKKRSFVGLSHMKEYNFLISERVTFTNVCIVELNLYFHREVSPTSARHRSGASLLFDSSSNWVLKPNNSKAGGACLA